MVANSKMIFLMHINSIIIDSMCELSFLNKRVSLVYGGNKFEWGLSEFALQEF